MSALDIKVLTFLIVLPHHAPKLCTGETHVRQHKSNQPTLPITAQSPTLALTQDKYQYTNTDNPSRKMTVWYFAFFMVFLIWLKMNFGWLPQEGNALLC